MWAIVGGDDAGWDNEHGIARRQTDDPMLDSHQNGVHFLVFLDVMREEIDEPC